MTTLPRFIQISTLTTYPASLRRKPHPHQFTVSQAPLAHRRRAVEPAQRRPGHCHFRAFPKNVPRKNRKAVN